MNPLLVVEEQADIVGRIIALRVDLLVGEKRNLRIGVAKQRDQRLRHRHAEAAAVDALEFRRIGEPAHAVAERADRQLDQHLLVAAVVVVRENQTVGGKRLDAHPDVVAFGAADLSFLDGRLIEDIAGVDVGQPDPPRPFAIRHDHPRAEIEIEAQSVRAALGRQLGGEREMGFRRRLRRGRGGPRRRSARGCGRGGLGRGRGGLLCGRGGGWSADRRRRGGNQGGSGRIREKEVFGSGLRPGRSFSGGLDKGAPIGVVGKVHPASQSTILWAPPAYAVGW
jgi:hypothetical protein